MEIEKSKNGHSNEGKNTLVSSSDDNKKVITGYALKFGERSKKLGNFYEVIDRHALDNVDFTDVKCLIDHDYSKILGRTKSDTLELKVDDVGLFFSVEIPNTSYALDLYESVKRGDISECSFGFKVDEKDRMAQQVQRVENGLYLRTVKKISTLSEVSIVANPAYSNTTADIKRDYEQAIAQHEQTKLKLEIELLNF